MIVLRALAFGAWFAGELVSSVARVLRDVVTPGSSATPRVVRLRLRGSGHAALLGTLITLTPGTLTLGVASDDGATLLVHSMYHHDDDAALADLREMESRLVRVRRPEEAR